MVYLDLARVYSGDLALPWNGVDWIIREPSAAEGVRLREMVTGGEYSSDDEVREIMRLLGHTPEDEDYTPDDDVWADLVNAGIGWASLMHLGRTALIHFSGMPEPAEAHWQTYQLAKLIVDTADREAAGEASA